MRLQIVFGVVVLAHLARVGPLMAQTITLTCPVGGAPFAADRTPPPAQAGMRMDLRPVAGSPTQLLPVPFDQCPDNGMVLYQESFTAEEIARLTPLVSGAEYQALRKTESPGFLAGWLLERQGEKNADVMAYYLLRAAWEMEGKDPAKYQEYLTRTIVAMTDALATKENEAEIAFTQLVIANLYRQLGRFEDAMAVMAQTPDAVIGAPNVLAYRERLLGLMAERSVAPALMQGP